MYLGGEVLAEQTNGAVRWWHHDALAGSPVEGMVYGAGVLLAEHGSDGAGHSWVEWKHEDPVTGARGLSYTGAHFQGDGGFSDPLGVDGGPPTAEYPAGGWRTGGSRRR